MAARRLAEHVPSGQEAREIADLMREFGHHEILRDAFHDNLMSRLTERKGKQNG